jgi:hypothetical protein
VAEFLEDIDERIAGLGKPLAEFAVRGGVLFRNLLIAPALFLLGATIVSGAFWVRAFNHVHLIAIGISLILMGVMLSVRALRNRGLRVLIFPEGLVRLWKEDAQALFWDEVDKLWKKKSQGHWARAWQGALIVKIQRNDGSSIEFDDSLPQLDKLSDILHRQTLPHLLPGAIEAYASGQSLDFGKLRVDRAGLKNETDVIRWSDIQEIKVGDDQLSVYKKGKWSRWCQTPVAEIPNAHVLRALLVQSAPTRVTNQ